MIRAGIPEEELTENFILGSGPGGQKINKTASCVQLRHDVTGVEVQCQEARSREQNRYLARVRLCEKIEQEKMERQRAAERKKARERYRKRRRSAAEKRKLRKFKEQRAEKKSWRKPLS